MNRLKSERYFFFWGVAVSWSWHFIWIFCLAPPPMPKSFSPAQAVSFFLGRILSNEDFSVFFPKVPHGAMDGREIPLSKRQAGLFEKSSVASVKPLSPRSGRRGTPRQQVQASRDRFSQPSLSEIVLQGDRAGIYVSGLVLSDLEKRIPENDVARSIDCQVKLDRDGEVLAVRKLSSTGDPVFDLAILFRLHQAKFNMEYFDFNKWIKVRLVLAHSQ